MKTNKKFLFVTFVLLAAYVLSACGGVPAAAPAKQAAVKVNASLVAYTGTLEGINGDQWIVNGQTLTVDPVVVRDGPFQVGDTVKVEGNVNPDGSFTVSSIQAPSASDLTDLPQLGNGNTNVNSNDANININDNINDNTNANSNDRNVNDVNTNINSNDNNSNDGNININSNDNNANDDDTNINSNDNSNGHDDDQDSYGNSNSSSNDDDHHDDSNYDGKNNGSSSNGGHDDSSHDSGDDHSSNSNDD